MERSGLGHETYLPNGVRIFPADKSMKSARAEAEMVMFGTMDMLFAETRAPPTLSCFLCISAVTQLPYPTPFPSRSMAYMALLGFQA